MMLLANTQETPREIFIWLVVIVAAAVVLAVIALILRKALLGQDEEPGAVGFTLADMRRMHAEGELSDAEFEQAKAQILAKGRALLLDDPEGGSIDSDDEPDPIEL